MGTALEDLGIPAPGRASVGGSSSGIPVPAQMAPNPNSDVGKGKAPHPGLGFPHAHVMANMYTSSKQEDEIAKTQLHQAQELINKKVGDETARKSIAPLMDVARVFNGIDISPVVPYTGLEGRAAYHYEQLINSSKTLQALGLKTSDHFRLAQAFHEQQAKVIADTVRQALKTSIRNQYVMHMIMPLTAVDVWKADPESAIMRFNYMKHFLNDRLQTYTILANKGIPLNKEEAQKMLSGDVPTEDPVAARKQLGEMRQRISAKEQAEKTKTAAVSDKQSWIGANKKANPDYSEKELSDIYDKKYGGK